MVKGIGHLPRIREGILRPGLGSRRGSLISIFAKPGAGRQQEETRLSQLGGTGSEEGSDEWTVAQVPGVRESRLSSGGLPFRKEETGGRALAQEVQEL